MRPDERGRQTNLSEKCSVPCAHGLNGGQQIFVLCIADMRLKCQGCLGGFFRSARGAEVKEKCISKDDIR
jgi:hypothetical protein